MIKPAGELDAEIWNEYTAWRDPTVEYSHYYHTKYPPANPKLKAGWELAWSRWINRRVS